LKFLDFEILRFWNFEILRFSKIKCCRMFYKKHDILNFFFPVPPDCFFSCHFTPFTPILTVFVVGVVRANYVPAHISHSFVPFTRLWIRAITCFILTFLFILHLNSLCIHSHAGARAHGKMKNETKLYSIVMLFYYIVLCSII